ncbi:hypothetical protein HPG69_016427 [Diceros bicornis minor]|uniref:Immunoglobulin V-set domain-containing protein n=1 Tax=Diceros bicornis minor TaxID=77932 RepID=A0A7J7EGC7_DICBM|nr:hypothetical protein HPG69_016427 [Diceros bicornis minor]
MELPHKTRYIWFLAPTGSVHTGITQIPKHLVTAMGSKGTLKGEHLEHNSMYWDKKNAKKSPELMFFYNNKELIENKTVLSRFLPECPDSSLLYLHMDALEPEDSAVYFCASSKDTALQSHLLPVHKPPGSSQEAVGATKAQFISYRALDRNLRP